MSGEKRKKRKGRKQYALTMIAWFAVLLLGNTVLNIAPIFPSQAWRLVERRLCIDRTRVIWQEKTGLEQWKEHGYYLAANEDVAVFAELEFFLGYGWEYRDCYLIDQNPQEPIHARWYRSFSATVNGPVNKNEFFLVGYVNSADVTAVEYEIHWGNDTVTTVEIPPEDYVYDGGDRYYVYDGYELVRDCRAGTLEYDIWDIYAVARDSQGEVLYRESLMGY